MIKRIGVKPTTPVSKFKFPLKKRFHELSELIKYVKKLPEFDEEIGYSIKEGPYYTDAQKTNKINPNKVKKFYFKQITNLFFNIFSTSANFDEKITPTRGLSVRTDQIIYNRKLKGV